MVPARAESRASGEPGAEIRQCKAIRSRGKHRPAFVDQRRAAGGETRLPDEIERIRARVIGDARGEDSQEIGIGDGEKILRSEAVRRIQNVSLAPADKLLAEFGRQFALCDGGVELAQRQRGTLQRTVLPIQMRRSFHLLMRVESGVERSG